MHRRTAVPALILAVLAAATAGAQEPANEPAGDDATAAAAALDDPAQPGTHHQHLARLAGRWRYTLKVWLTPDGEPVEASGTAEARTILGGRFLHTVYRGELLGRPYESWSTDGYDNQAKQYVGTWRDTQGTYTLIYRGSCSEEGAERTTTAELTDPATGTKFQIRAVTTIEDDDRYVYTTSLVLPEGTEFRNLELTAVRADG